MNSDTEYNFISYIYTLPKSPETLSMIKYFENQIKFKKQTLHFKDKFSVIMSFVKFAKTICHQSQIKIYGSFIRTIFEKIFVSTADIGYADPINHDIDIVLYDNKRIFDLNKRKFYDFISLMQIVSNTKQYDFNFNGFEIIDIIEQTLTLNDERKDVGCLKNFLIDIPHYVIILQKDRLKIKIDMLAYKIITLEFDTWQNEFNINSLTMTQNGIYIKTSADNDTDSYNFYETINCIINKTAISNMPFESIARDLTQYLRIDKINICNQIIWFFAHRMKIMSLGYSDIYSDILFFNYYIEYKEICHLTSNEPNYINIKLLCNHYISIMALVGLVNIKSSEWVESIQCPICRADLNFSFIQKKPTLIQIPALPEKILEIFDNYEIKDSVLSNDNLEYIMAILNNKSFSIPTSIQTTPRESRPLIGRRIDETYTRLPH